MTSSSDCGKKQTGRPTYAPSADVIERAAFLARDGSDDATIADAIGVSLPTLRKHLGDVIASARAENAPTMFDGADPAPAAIQPLPPSAPRRRGRPRYQPLASDRDRVRILAAAGISREVIAGRMNISVPTLVKAHAADLGIAREMARAQIIEELHRQMRKGSTSAASRLADMINEADLASLRANAPVTVKPDKPERETLGKKVQAARSAQDEANHGRWSKSERIARLQ